MKKVNRLFTLVLSIILACTILLSCTSHVDKPFTEETNNAETYEATDLKESTEAAHPENVLIDLPESCTWVIEPGKFNGNIRPIYSDLTIYQTEYSILETDEGCCLIDQKGNMLADLVPENAYIYDTYDLGFNYCTYCGYITTHTYRLDENTMTVTDKNVTEHGGTGRDYYTCDKNTGKLYYQYPSHYVPASAEYATAYISERQPVSEEEIRFYKTNYKYENTDGAGIVSNGQVVVSGYIMCTPFSCGVTALFDGEKWGYFDKEGKELFPCEYDAFGKNALDKDYTRRISPYPATEGIITLHKDGKAAFANVEGNMITDFIFEKICPVYNKKAWVKTAAGWGLISIDYDFVNTTEESDYIANASNTVSEHFGDEVAP